MSAPDSSTPAGLVDLAAARIGGVALVANDEFFAEKENLLRAGRGIFIPDKYTDHGKWMDGWETRRRRTPGHDWCVVQLGLRGIVRQVDIDTNHFLGNHPPFASLDALCLTTEFPRELESFDRLPWTTLLAKSSLNPGAQIFSRSTPTSPPRTFASISSRTAAWPDCAFMGVSFPTGTR